jgi:hypothetical protein
MIINLLGRSIIRQGAAEQPATAAQVARWLVLLLGALASSHRQ